MKGAAGQPFIQTAEPTEINEIIGSLVVDEHHLTNGQLLAKARDLYAQAAKSRHHTGEKFMQKRDISQVFTP